MKKALLVNGSYNEIPLIEKAHEMGYFVITSGNDSTGAGHKYSDKYVPCDYSQKEKIYEIAAREKVDVICSCGNDFGALSASYAAEKLGIKGHDSFETSKLFHEKDCFKELCNKLHLSTPMSSAFTDVNLARKHVDNVVFPQIIKPSDLSGGKGMTVVNSKEEAFVAIDKAFKASKIKVVLIEDYIDGEQYGFTCFVKNKRVVFTYLSRDLSYLNPFMVWSAVGLFADEKIELRRKITDDVEKIAHYTNMYDGMFTFQLIVKNEEPYYIETMRRCLGNMHYLCLSNDLGIDVFKLFLSNEFGLDVNLILNGLKKQEKASAFMGIYSRTNGEYLSYSINPEYNSKLFYQFDILQKNDTITNYLVDKIANVFFSFDSQAERNKFIDDRFNIFKVEMEKKHE